MTLEINWKKMEGLLPAIVQNIHTRDVLMLGYMNQEALQKTVETGHVTFYSRSKQRLWTKGETSLNYLHLHSIQTDCDQDALLIFVEPAGPTCHKGNNSCFVDENPSENILEHLRLLIKQRNQNRPMNSYLSQLFNEGTQRIAQKVGEEGLEVALEAVLGNTEALREEIADLLFHVMVLMEDQKIEFSQILNILKKRKSNSQ